MILLLLAQAAATPMGPAPVGPASTERTRYEHCLDRANSDPAGAEAEAGQWKLGGGAFLASQCLGMAYSREQRWPAASAAFEAAATAAEKAKDARSANYWAQAGNAWLAAGDPSKARTALDAAIASGTLTGLPLGEAHLDRARALVAANDTEGARDDLDRALGEVPADPLAWLLSATLARRDGDMPRARKDIAEALRLGGDDSDVQLEAGNIAAKAGDATNAKAAWQQAVDLRPDSPSGKAAAAALRQFSGAP
ncbi:tetratricopeptide repeat protein [Sphingomonas sp. TREG-RG-20F-R18-01]|uniref:tetratricopeptide repeat protein n=1 Tax=Sphingomonas sp. TREG-RG-20F-R18-01 TaxID=2914982 RepID=UPI001F563E0B|nr:tetratricopeptide repeat protein [Sphingomonas sp. TREG-RG-20F-R18-01]